VIYYLNLDARKSKTVEIELKNNIDEKVVMQYYAAAHTLLEKYKYVNKNLTQST